MSEMIYAPNGAAIGYIDETTKQIIPIQQLAAQLAASAALAQAASLLTAALQPGLYLSIGEPGQVMAAGQPNYNDSFVIQSLAKTRGLRKMRMRKALANSGFTTFDETGIHTYAPGELSRRDVRRMARHQKQLAREAAIDALFGITPAWMSNFDRSTAAGSAAYDLWNLAAPGYNTYRTYNYHPAGWVDPNGDFVIEGFDNVWGDRTKRVYDATKHSEVWEELDTNKDHKITPNEIEAYQKAHNLKVDGKIGYNTLNAMGLASLAGAKDKWDWVVYPKSKEEIEKETRNTDQLNWERQNGIVTGSNNNGTPAAPSTPSTPAASIPAKNTPEAKTETSTSTTGDSNKNGNSGNDSKSNSGSKSSTSDNSLDKQEKLRSAYGLNALQITAIKSLMKDLGLPVATVNGEIDGDFTRNYEYMRKANFSPDGKKPAFSRGGTSLSSQYGSIKWDNNQKKWVKSAPAVSTDTSKYPKHFIDNPVFGKSSIEKAKEFYHDTLTGKYDGWAEWLEKYYSFWNNDWYLKELYGGKGDNSGKGKNTWWFGG